MSSSKVGRNDACPCGSGKKFKQCCQNSVTPPAPAATQSTSPILSRSAIPTAIRSAIAHQEAGRLQEAEAIYQQVLQVAPNHPDALHLLGVIAIEVGMYDVAVDLICQALTVHPSAAMYFNLGNALKAQSLLAEAVDSYREALALQPDYVDAHRNLGLALHAQGQSEAALASLRRALALAPNYAELHGNLGLVLKDSGQLDHAAASFQRALALRPDYAEAHCNLGVVFKMQGSMQAAIACYQAALALRPDYVDAHCNLGNAFYALTQFDLARDSLLQALASNPNSAQAQNNLGNVYQAQGQLEAALDCYHAAIALQADFAMPYNNCGTVLAQQGRPAAALEQFARALQCQPDYSEAHYNLANTLQELEQFDAAIVSYRRALALEPDSAQTYCNLGNALKAQSKLDEAVDSYRQAIRLQPNLVVAHSNLGTALLDQGDTAAAIVCFQTALALQPDYFEAHSNLLLALCLDADDDRQRYCVEAQRFDEKVRLAATPFQSWLRRSGVASTGPLRVGLVSGDLRAHPVGFFLESILAHIDPQRLALVAYSTQPHEDAVSARIRPYFSEWHCIARQTDAEAAQLIHADGIDILIDLAGHTGHNRLPLFAWKAAPVQVSWLGYFASTGVSAIDFLLTDPAAVPDQQIERFSETMHILPDTRLCFTAPTEPDALPALALPALKNGYLTFACFQNLSKINDAVLALWAPIYQALPSARLYLQNRQMNCPQARQRLLQRLAAFGIAPERVTLQGYLPRHAYLAAHQQVDLILDTFPYPGGTTTCEALWMGVPTLTLKGETMLARQGASLLSAAGLPDWIAVDKADYVAKALAHTADLRALAQLRAGLRELLASGPLLDGAHFAAQLEKALHEMWVAKAH